LGGCRDAIAQVLNRLLHGFEAGASSSDLYALAGVYAALAVTRMFVMHMAAQHIWLLGTQTRSAVIGAIYRKLLRLR